MNVHHSAARLQDQFHSDIAAGGANAANVHSAVPSSYDITSHWTRGSTTDDQVGSRPAQTIPARPTGTSVGLRQEHTQGE